MLASAGAGGDDDRGGSGRNPKGEGHREPGKQRIVGMIGRNKLRVQETRDGVTKEWVEGLTDSDEEAPLPESPSKKQKPAFPDWNMGGPVEVTIQQRRGRFNVEWVEKHEECSFGWAGDRYANLEAMDKALGILRKAFSRMESEKDMSMKRSAATSNPLPGSSKNIHSGTSASHTGTSASHTGTSSASGGTENTSEPSPTGDKDECSFSLAGDLEAMEKDLEKAMDILMEAEKAMSMERSAATSNPSPGSSKNIHSGTSASHTGTSASGGTENTSEPSPTGNKDESNDSEEDDKRKEV